MKSFSLEIYAFFGTMLCVFLFCLADGNQTTIATSSEASEADYCHNYGTITRIVNYLSNHLASIIGGKQNFFFSPFCISVSLAMTYLGARGETAKEMEEALGYSQLSSEELPTKVHELFQRTLNSLDSTMEAYSLEVANGLFVQDGFEILPSYIRDLKNLYAAKVLPVDFKFHGEIATSKVNEWVANYTAGKIEKLMDDPLDPMTVLLLANAIYFKGFWKYPFSQRLTRQRDFYGQNNTTKKISFMEFKKRVKFFNDDSTNYTFLQLDYRGDDISMVFALPYDRNEFPNLEISPNLMCRIRKSLESRKTHVLIPKFSLAYQRELSTDLYHLGLGNLFSEERSNLTGMRHENDLFVSAVVHKAVIEINEQGSEASAANSVSFHARSGHSQGVTFKADHPFLFCILDKRSGTILFLGRLVDP